MKRILSALTLVLLWQSAAANSQSIAEAARKERERQATAGNVAPVVRSSAPPAAQTEDRTGGRKTDPEVGASITIQPGWQWTPSQNSPANPAMTVYCPGQRTYGCQVRVDSLVIPLNQTQITYEERWSIQQTDRGRVLYERETTVAGYPALDVMIDTGSGRVRIVAIVVPGVRRYLFRFKAVDLTQFQPRDQYDEYASTFEQMLQSFAPLGRTELQGTNARLSAVLLNEEQDAESMVSGMVFYENFCKEEKGKYFPLEEIVRGCGIPSLADGFDPQHIFNNPDYTYKLTLTDSSFEITATPKRSGIGGFFGDGKHIYFNPKGPATRSDRVVE